VPTLRIAIPSTKSNQLRITRGVLPGRVMRRRDETKVARRIIPKTVPPVRSAVLKVRLRSRSGWRQMKDKTSDMVPAARRQKSKNDHASIRCLDNIILRDVTTKIEGFAEVDCMKLFPEDTLPESRTGLEPARDLSRNRTKDDQRPKNCPAEVI